MSPQRITRKVTQRRGESPAECCARMGWTVGTEIVGDEGYGPTTIRITAIGERKILARPIEGRYQREGSWVLDCRDWQLATNPRDTNAVAGDADGGAS